MEKAPQEDLDRLQNWCIENQIFVNAQKTEYMLFGSKSKINLNVEMSIHVGQSKLERVNSYTYSGVTLDEQLNYESHMSQIIKRVSDKLYQLNKIRYFLNTRAALLLLVYKNMILPIVEYGDVFAISATLETRKKLQKLQNRGLKLAMGKDKLFSTKKLHSEAKLQKLIWRRKQHLGQLSENKKQ